MTTEERKAGQADRENKKRVERSQPPAGARVYRAS